VAIEHRFILRLVDPINGFRLGDGAVVLQLAPVAFDASTLEIWGPLLNGGSLVMAPPGQLTPAELASLLRERQNTTLWLTAGLFHAMVESELAALPRIAPGNALSCSSDSADGAATGAIRSRGRPRGSLLGAPAGQGRGCSPVCDPRLWRRWVLLHRFRPCPGPRSAGVWTAGQGGGWQQRAPPERGGDGGALRRPDRQAPAPGGGASARPVRWRLGGVGGGGRAAAAGPLDRDGGDPGQRANGGHLATAAGFLAAAAHAAAELPVYGRQLSRSKLPRTFLAFLRERQQKMASHLSWFQPEALRQPSAAPPASAAEESGLDYFDLLHRRYRPGCLPLRVHLFHSRHDPRMKHRLWRALACGGVEVRPLFEEHHHFHDPSLAGELAAAIAQALETIEGAESLSA
jgi:hypothetical protein